MCVVWRGGNAGDGAPADPLEHVIHDFGQHGECVWLWPSLGGAPRRWRCCTLCAPSAPAPLPLPGS